MQCVLQRTLPVVKVYPHIEHMQLFLHEHPRASDTRASQVQVEVEVCANRGARRLAPALNRKSLAHRHDAALECERVSSRRKTGSRPRRRQQQPERRGLKTKSGARGVCTHYTVYSVYSAHSVHSVHSHTRYVPKTGSVDAPVRPHLPRWSRRLHSRCTHIHTRYYVLCECSPAVAQ